MRWREPLLCTYRCLRHKVAIRRGRYTPSFAFGVFNPTATRRALLIYLPPALFKEGASTIYHQNRGQAIGLGRALASRGFRVDVSAPGSFQIPRDAPYHIVIDLHPGLTRYPATSSTIRVAYITGSNPEFSNAAEHQRLADLAKRRAIRLKARRQVPLFSSQDLCSCSSMWFVGSRQNLSTFSDLPLPKVSFVGNFAYPIPDIISCGRDPKRFVFLASGGQVHKGLDRLLEIFAHRTEWTLHVCSSFHEEPDFCWAFRRELFHRPNIIPNGFQRIDSAAFKAIAAGSTFMVLPSCSEANAGSVLSAMSAGLIPIVSRECGFEAGEVEYFPDCSIDTIEKTLAEQASRNPPDLVQARQHIKRTIETQYSFAAYRTSIEAALDLALCRTANDPTNA